MIRQTSAGVEVDVRVIPRARTTTLAGIRNDALVVRVAAPPIEGAANDALIECLAARLSVPRRAIRIISGDRARRKRILIESVPVEVVRQLVGAR